jgi:undecaprenyl-diphosphatase
MDIIKLDQDLFVFINGFVGKSSFFDSLAKLMVNEYFVPTILSLILFAFWFYWDGKDKNLKQKSVLLGVLGVILGSIGIVSLINLLVQRARPFEVLETNLLFYRPTDPSFPSNSAVVAFALAYAIFIADRKIGLASLGLAAFYGFLRVFVGVHFPLDVIVGALIGIVSVVFVNLFGDFLTKILVLLQGLLKRLHLEEFS